MGLFDKIFKSNKNDKIVKSSKNFTFLDEKIISGLNEIVLESDITLSNNEISKYSDGIKLDIDNLVIDGNGHTIDAKGKSKIFYCTGKNITIKNIILKNGFVKSTGGAISVEKGSKVTLINTILQDNKARSGGAIENMGDLTIMDSTITNNTATEYGDSGAIFASNCDLTIINSIFDKNTSVDGGGGVMYCINTKLKIADSTFRNNTSEYGGAIYSDRSNLNITDSMFINNKATKNRGGAIVDLNNKSLKLDNCEFKDNNPNNVEEF